MGSLGYIVGGALAGAGEGAERAAAESQKFNEQRELQERYNKMQTAMEEMRARLQLQNEQTMENQRYGHESELTQKRITAASAIAANKLAYMGTALDKTLENKRAVAGILAGPRQGAVAEKAREFDLGGGPNNPANKSQPPLFRYAGRYTAPAGPATYGAPASKPLSLPVYYMGSTPYIKVPGTTKYAPFDGKHVPSAAEFSRAAAPDIVAGVSTDPSRMIPGFAQRFGYIDESHVVNYSKPWKSPQPGIPHGLPPGAKFEPAPDSSPSNQATPPTSSTDTPEHGAAVQNLLADEPPPEADVSDATDLISG